MKNLTKLSAIFLLVLSAACTSNEEEMAEMDSADEETVELTSQAPTAPAKVDVPAEVHRAVHEDKEPLKKTAKSKPANTDDFVWHEVRKGEWLGKILREKDLKPIWGTGNYAEQVVKLNPDAFDKDGNLNPGSKIKIPTHLRK